MLRNRLPDQIAEYPDPKRGINLRKSPEDLGPGEAYLLTNFVYDGGLRKRWGSLLFSTPSLGNHDAQANGRKVYRRMFGPLNYAAAFAGMKFIFYNSNAWEFPCCVPDLGWLENQLRDAGDSLTTFCVSHIIPYGDQLDSAVSHSLEDLMEDYRVTLSIHGHQHNWHYGRLLEEDGLYLIVDDIGARNYAKVTVSGVRVEVERIYF